MSGTEPIAVAGGAARSSARDDVARRTDAAVAVAWLIVANKPVFPLYVWWFVGTGTAAAYLTAVSAPGFLAIALWGRRRPLAARLALPLLGAVDTLAATALFGETAGMELFFVPCLLLAVVSFGPGEGGRTRALVAMLFVVFVGAHGRFAAPLGPWTGEEAGRLLEVVIFAVASLGAFIGWRFAPT